MPRVLPALSVVHLLRKRTLAGPVSLKFADSTQLGLFQLVGPPERREPHAAAGQKLRGVARSAQLSVQSGGQTATVRGATL